MSETNVYEKEVINCDGADGLRPTMVTPIAPKSTLSPVMKRYVSLWLTMRVP